MYVVKSGEVQVAVGNHYFESVPAGGIVGEMALISEHPRSATVRALRESVVSCATAFFAIRVMRVMSARLEAMNERITSVSGK
jgi:CRP/FNR family transcriptional regulator, cyclic AMP receptor protein